MSSHRRLIYFVVLFLILTASACDNSSSPDKETPRYFEFTRQGGETEYTFVARTSDPVVIDKVEAELSKPLQKRNLHIHGDIARGSTDYNDSWSWHFVPGQWDLVEISIEVCDGIPGMVEDDLDYWVDQLGNFCPWSSRVSAEVNAK